VIRASFSMYRLDGLGPDEFRSYWFDVHAPLLRELAPVLGLRRYVQLHPTLDDAAAGIARVRGLAPSPDGVAELWWDHLDDVLGTTPEAKAGYRRLMDDERRFIDLSRSTLVFATARPIIQETE